LLIDVANIVQETDYGTVAAPRNPQGAQRGYGNFNSSPNSLFF
jgi:hypothetical protein